MSDREVTGCAQLSTAPATWGQSLAPTLVVSSRNPVAARYAAESRERRARLWPNAAPKALPLPPPKPRPDPTCWSDMDSDQRLAAIRTMRQAGLSYRQIGERLDAPSGTINGFVLRRRHRSRRPVHPHHSESASARAIIEMAAEYCGITLDEILSPSRTARIARPRQIAMLMLREQGKSFPWVVRQFGLNNHTTALHATRRVKAMEQADPDFAADLAALRSQIEELAQ